MKEKLEKLLENSYSPYSKFRVSAIVKMNDGKEFPGVNVENASYGSTLCAEKSAIVAAISNGYKKYDIDKLYIMVDSNKISTCCFSCRQIICELMDKDKDIVLMNKNGVEKVFKVKELCPYPFDEGDLK